ncbi:ATP-binding cassette domain-containing protein [Herbaspirillum seropedicae]|uniref:Cell division ATP-binding protein FtsE n=1 Tax=Herbaspirillum seropedicae (strain SmR1) TaxID=757424 RepID=D8IQ27_HERSS|nr:ATP-binding cassette domain-containing protein [Herbaspirillum seropedicae]ADJ63073.1 ABC-type metal ion transport system, ATPase component protein [Herbaspirillum seropedicae SmR1]AKN65151.1 methionine ABC transporter ATP-binding protein [Herbaspirillum seropedicae]NQE32165.1 methionine ABC transporter ATP-binding protein [Herbaspirillum seropedicae]UMU21103.1 ATP-binding cassette domain-containing protein [Herbaspirillum seropedicae]
MIRIEQLHKTYRAGQRDIIALRDINLDIAQGEVFGIIGRSGAGKSTLIRTLNVLERPDSGRVLIDGEDITGLGHEALLGLRQRVGMVFQHFNLLNAKTVAQNIDWPLKITGRYSREERAARVDELLQLVGLDAHRDQYPSQLSGGQKQRVGIARALANHPRLLLCDEATSALDPETTQSILRLLLEINRKLGLTIVLITHEMEVIRSICDRVAVLDGGAVAEQGRVVDIFLRPQHAVTRSLLTQSHAWDAGESLYQRRPDGKLVRLTYAGDIAAQPILSQLTAATSALATIVRGTVSRIKDTPYGQLLVEFSGDADALAQVLDRLQTSDIEHEVLA